MDVVRGIDKSSKVTDQYNAMVEKACISSEKIRAIQGDLFSPEATPALKLPEFFDFDLIIICLGLHHMSDPERMILELSKRLGEGGVLVIMDWLAEPDNGSPTTPCKRKGFGNEAIHGFYEKAGLKGWQWKLAREKSKVPRETNSEQQLFLARGIKQAT